MLNCGIHTCPQQCHQLFDHSKMKCESVLKEKCPKGHVKSWKCHATAPLSCHRCERDAKDLQQKQQKALEDQERRERADLKHAKQMAQLDEELEIKRQTQRDTQLEKARDLAIQQKKNEIIAATQSLLPKTELQHERPRFSTDPLHIAPSRSNTNHDQSALHLQPMNPIPRVSASTKRESAAKDVWQRQKDVEGANNEAIDSIMEMIGLEDVKCQILRIKDKIDVGKRQNTSSKDQRFNVIFQGNPGTGSFLHKTNLHNILLTTK